MKKIYLNIFFQAIAIIIIIRIFFYENYQLEKLSFLFNQSIILLFLFVIFSKILLTYLFYNLLKVVSSKKERFHKTSNYFLQGGMVNQLLPGVGFIYKYYKFKKELDINVSQFSTAQTLWSIFNLSAYIILAIIFGYASIKLNFMLWVILTSAIFFILSLIFVFRNRIYLYLKEYLLSIKRISTVIGQLSEIKKSLIEHKFSIIFIFFGFIFLAMLQSFNFFIGLKIFGSNITFMSSNYVYLSSSLASIITMFNFIGGFELIIHFSSSLIAPNVKNIMLFAFAYRLISIISTFILIIIFSLWNLLDNRFNIIK